MCSASTHMRAPPPPRLRPTPSARRPRLRARAGGAQVREVEALEEGLMAEAQRFIVLGQTDSLWKEHLQARARGAASVGALSSPAPVHAGGRPCEAAGPPWRGSSHRVPLLSELLLHTGGAACAGGFGSGGGPDVQALPADHARPPSSDRPRM